MTGQTQTDAVTGAFSYSGAVIARELLAAGHQVRTLTGHPGRAPAGTAIETHPLDFRDPDGLARALTGVHTLYSNYWIRFAHGAVSHQRAVANSQVLYSAAARAGVRRIVHVSITHASLDSPYPYFLGKAQVEQYLATLGIPHAIVRPAVLFGGKGVLINNIAWLLRRFPVFPVGGDGSYRIRAIHVDDLARLCVELGGQDGTTLVDAVGPQAPTFRELVTAIRAAVGSRALIVSVPGAVIPPMASLLGLVLRDVLLTGDEYRAMAAGLADSAAPATGRIGLTDWIAANGASLGRRYLNELDLHFRPPAPPTPLPA
jgi:nucleoside-diphosphate-sugar epimerase